MAVFGARALLVRVRDALAALHQRIRPRAAAPLPRAERAADRRRGDRGAARLDPLRLADDRPEGRDVPGAARELPPRPPRPLPVVLHGRPDARAADARAGSRRRGAAAEHDVRLVRERDRALRRAARLRRLRPGHRADRPRARRVAGDRPHPGADAGPPRRPSRRPRRGQRAARPSRHRGHRGRRPRDRRPLAGPADRLARQPHLVLLPRDEEHHHVRGRRAGGRRRAGARRVERLALHGLSRSAWSRHGHPGRRPTRSTSLGSSSP